MLRRRWIMLLSNLPYWLSSKKTIWVNRFGKLITALGITIKIDRAVNAGTDVPLVEKPSEDLDANSRVWTLKAIPLQAYIICEPITDKKVITARISGAIACLGCVCRRIASVSFNRLSTAIQAIGAIAAYCKKVVVNRTAELIQVFAVTVNTIDRFCNGKNANVSTGAAETVTASDAAQTETVTSAVSASGTEIGIDAASKTASIGKIICWIYPTVIGDTILIPQVFSGVQVKETLEIDLETESAYWANAFVIDDTMSLVFAETTTQNNNILEVS